MEASSPIPALIIAALAIGLLFLIFNWFMSPTKKLLEEQNRLLRKQTGEPEPIKVGWTKEHKEWEARQTGYTLFIVAGAILVCFFLMAYFN